MEEIAQQKRCAKCGEVKILAHFSKDKTKSDGHHSQCKSCINAAHRERFRHRYDVPVPKPEKRTESIQQKLCKRCNYIKPIANFGKDASCSDGYNRLCRSCINEKSLEMRRSLMSRESIPLPEKKRCKSCGTVKPVGDFRIQRNIHSGLASSCRECANQYDRKRKRSSTSLVDPVKRRQRHLQSAYGFSEGEYNRLLQEQHGACAICSKRPDPGKVLVVDHDHATGKARGLLCDFCNMYLGRVERGSCKKLAFLIPASRYLYNHQWKETHQAS